MGIVKFGGARWLVLTACRRWLYVKKRGDCIDLCGYCGELGGRRTEHFCVCFMLACVCVCGGMYLLKLLSAGIVGLAMVAVCTYRADCIP